MHIYVLYNAVIDYCDLTFITRGGYGGALLRFPFEKTSEEERSWLTASGF